MHFFDRQPPILTARIDRVLAVLDQNDRPVAQKMRTGLFYLELLVLGKNYVEIFLSLFIVRNLLLFLFLS